MPLLLAFHEFVRSEGHTLAQTRDQKCICHCQQREILAERDFLRVQENDGLVSQRRKRGVNASDSIRDATSEFIRLGSLQRDLDKDDLKRTRVRGVFADTHIHTTFPWNSGFFFKNRSNASILCLTPYNHDGSELQTPQ